MNYQRLSFLIASLIGFIGSLLPWYASTGYALHGFDTNGKITVFLFVAVAVLSLVGYVTTQMSASLLVTQLNLGIGALVVSFLNIISPTYSMNTYLPNSAGIGLWLTLLAAIAVIVTPLAIPNRLTGQGFAEFFRLFQNPNPKPVYGQTPYAGQQPQGPYAQSYQQPVQPQYDPATQAVAYPGQAPVQPQQPVQYPGQAPVQPQQPVQYPGQTPVSPQAPAQQGPVAEAVDPVSDEGPAQSEQPQA